MKCVCGKELKMTKKKVKLTVPIPENYGIKEYTKEQKELHGDIQKLITTKYREMGADDCLLVFVRVYSAFALAYLKGKGFLKFVGK